MQNRITRTGKQLLFLLACSFVLLGASACSKKQRIENRLERVGKWENTIYHVKTITYGYYTQNESDTERRDAGYMEFKENGDFVWVIRIDGNETTRTGVWENTKEEIIFTESNSEVWNFKIEQCPKKKMKLKCVKMSGSSNNASNPYQSFKHIYTLDFKKS